MDISNIEPGFFPFKFKVELHPASDSLQLNYSAWRAEQRWKNFCSRHAARMIKIWEEENNSSIS